MWPPSGVDAPDMTGVPVRFPARSGRVVCVLEYALECACASAGAWCPPSGVGLTKPAPGEPVGVHALTGRVAIWDWGLIPPVMATGSVGLDPVVTTGGTTVGALRGADVPKYARASGRCMPFPKAGVASFWAYLVMLTA